MEKRNLNRFLEGWFDGGAVTEEAGQGKVPSGMHVARSAAKEGADPPREA